MGQHSQSEHSSRIGAYRSQLQENPHDRHVPASKLTQRTQKFLVALFIVVVAIGLFFLSIDRWRRGTTAIGVGMVFLAVIRWIVDSEVLGIFAVRSRKFDSIFAAVIGLAMMYLAISVDTLGS